MSGAGSGELWDDLGPGRGGGGLDLADFAAATLKFHVQQTEMLGGRPEIVPEADVMEGLLRLQDGEDELGMKFGMSLDDDDNLHLPDIHQLLEEEEEEEAPQWDEVPRARPAPPRIVSVTELEPAKESAAAPAVVVAAAVAPPLMVPVQVQSYPPASHCYCD